MTHSNSPNIWRGRIIRYAPLFLWLAVIFINSSSVGATNNTSRLIRPLLEWLCAGATGAQLDIYHGYIRKLAHFTEYAVLAFFAARAFRLSARTILREFWFVWAFLFVVFAASADEYNQSFNVARTGSIDDALIDVSGGLAMILLLVFYKYLKRR